MEYQEKIKMMLESLPDKILTKEEDILEKSEEADKLELETKSTETSYERQIANELEGDKKKYKNEKEREAELDLRLGRNTIYKENIKKMAELRKEIKEESILLSYLKRRFQASVSLSRLGE